MAYVIDKQLSSLKVRELPINRRQQLSSYLNIEQVLLSDCGLSRDYRGVAQQLDLCYSDISHLQKQPDPFGTLLTYQNVCKLSIQELFELFVYIGRYDILDDMIPLILEDLNNYSLNNDLAVLDNVSQTIWYDAYVCYADTDIEFVHRLANYLESPKIGFRLFIRDRDLLGGNWVYETFAKLIETQCHRMIIILSPDFLQCPDCKFQSQFAAGLAIEQCSRKLIPIIYKQCNLPSMIRLLSKIDMSGGQTIPEWSMNRLVRSIRDTEQYHKQTPPMISYPESNQSNGSVSNLIEFNETIVQKIDTEQNNENNHTNKANDTLISVISENGETSQLIRDPNGTSNFSTEKESKSLIKSIKRKIKIF